MGKRFIICVNSSTKEQEKQFVELAKTQGVGWWHWLANIWLIVDANDKTKASDWRDSVRQIFGQQYALVIELNQGGDTWAGIGPASEGKNMFKWIKNNWKRK